MADTIERIVMEDHGFSYAYKVEDFTVNLPADEYIANFRNPDCFMKCCKECGNYGKVWACPPFSHDILAELRQYTDVILFATKIMPCCNDVPISEVQQFIRPERIRLEKQLLSMEQKYCGTARAFAYAGSCLYCPEGTCSRLDNMPCRHPELVRPSLESYGFDLGKTATELFGFPLVWGHDGKLPEYLTLICGLFHNKK